MKLLPVVAAVVMSCAWAQDIKTPPSFEKLAAKAKEKVEVTLDGSTLALGSGFLSNKNADEAAAKQLISNLKGIYVRTFEFEKEGEYTQADVDAVRTQLQAPQWARTVNVQQKSESVEVYFKPVANGQLGGIVVIAAEPKQLTIVNISGTIKPEDLQKLGGQFGIPNVEMGNRSTPQKKATTESKKKDE